MKSNTHTYIIIRSLLGEIALSVVCNLKKKKHTSLSANKWSFWVLQFEKHCSAYKNDFTIQSCLDSVNKKCIQHTFLTITAYQLTTYNIQNLQKSVLWVNYLCYSKKIIYIVQAYIIFQWDYINGTVESLLLH